MSKVLLDEKRLQYDADLAAIMSTPHGRRFVWRLLDDVTQLFSSCGSNVAIELARHDGVRMVGAHIKGEVLRVAPADFVHMYQEAVRRQSEDDLRRKAVAQAQEE